MHRFFAPDLAVSDPPSATLPDLMVELDRDESQHVRRVLRLGPGDTVELFDGRGSVAQAVIHAIAPSVQVRVTAIATVPPSRPAVTVAVALPKGSRADDMMNQLSQLGAAEVIPLRTARSVVDARPTKRDRLARLALESGKQCGRSHMMSITDTDDLTQVIARPYDLKLIAACEASDSPSPAELHNLFALAKTAVILIGPEGGWTDDEHAAAVRAGFRPWRLGPHVMRIETAAVAAMAIAGIHCSP